MMAKVELRKGCNLNHCNTNDWSVETFEDTISLINNSNFPHKKVL